MSLDKNKLIKANPYHNVPYESRHSNIRYDNVLQNNVVPCATFTTGMLPKLAMATMVVIVKFAVPVGQQLEES